MSFIYWEKDKGMKKSFFLLILIFVLVDLFPADTTLKTAIKNLDENTKVGKQYLVIIAINEYENWLPLKSPVKDAKEIKEILEKMSAVAEGIETTRLIYNIAKKENIEMPVTEQVYLLLFEDKPAKKAVYDLMTRDLKAEGN